MQQTFRVKPFDRYANLILSLIFLGVIAVTPWMKVVNAHTWQGRIFLSVLFSSIILTSLYSLLHSWRTILTIDGDQISLQGILRRRQFHLKEIEEAIWETGRILRLKTPGTQCSIHLTDFTTEEQANLVSFFHYRLPVNIQLNFANYCLKFLPQKQRTELSEVPTAEHALITRRRIDWFFIPALLVLLVPGIVVGYIYGDWVPLYFIFMMTVLWFITRWNTPPQGKYEPSITSKPEVKAFLWSILFCFLIILAGFAFASRIADDSIKIWFARTVYLLSFAPLIFFGIRLCKAASTLCETEEEAAIAEWEKLNPPPAN